MTSDVPPAGPALLVEASDVDGGVVIEDLVTGTTAEEEGGATGCHVGVVAVGSSDVDVQVGAVDVVGVHAGEGGRVVRVLAAVRCVVVCGMEEEVEGI